MISPWFSPISAACPRTVERLSCVAGAPGRPNSAISRCEKASAQDSGEGRGAKAWRRARGPVSEKSVVRNGLNENDQAGGQGEDDLLRWKRQEGGYVATNTKCFGQPVVRVIAAVIGG
jgi:hypothetical protein